MRQILHIDMNSYFATVEQQANPKLRGKPVAVLGSKAKRTIIVAASVEAKRRGVKTGTRVEDAPKLCPEIIFVHGEPRKYSWVTKKFVEIFEDYTDKVEIFSIDECFLDVTQTAGLFASFKLQASSSGEKPSRHEAPGLEAYLGAVNIALEIKRRIREEIGSYISCSVGVSHNKFLAKTGSNLKKPDGLVVITSNTKHQTPNSKQIQNLKTQKFIRNPELEIQNSEPLVLTVDEALLPLPLTDYCGIGSRIGARLGMLGVENTQQLRDFPNVLLNKEFGIAIGEKLKRMSWGLDNSPVVSWHDRADAKSYGHSRTLNKNVTDRNEIRRHILLLSEKIASRMRKDGCMGKEVGLWLRFGDFGGVGHRHRIGKWTHDGVEIYDAAATILSTLSLRAPVRAIGVYVTGIQRTERVTRSFLDSDALNDKILSAMDAVNQRFGETVVTRARLAGLKIKEVVSGMGRDKF